MKRILFVFVLAICALSVKGQLSLKQLITKLDKGDSLFQKYFNENLENAYGYVSEDTVVFPWVDRVGNRGFNAEITFIKQHDSSVIKIIYKVDAYVAGKEYAPLMLKEAKASKFVMVSTDTTLDGEKVIVTHKWQNKQYQLEISTQLNGDLGTAPSERKKGVNFSYTVSLQKRR